MNDRVRRLLLGVCVVVLAAGCRTSKLASSGAMTTDALMMPSPAESLAASPELGVGSGEAAETAGVEQTTNATDRLITYDATLRVVVQDIAGSLNTLKSMAANLKGYMQSMSENAIILRIPAPRLNDAMQQVEKLGEVTGREVKGVDVTEEMMDLDIRLRNTLEMRDRLAKLLEKGDKVEDLLKVEKELQRVTESLELLKGRIKYLGHAVTFSTLTVLLNSPVPQNELREVIPFPWVRNLATGVLLPSESSFVPARHWRTWLKLDLPPSFVKLYESDGYTRAMSGSGVLLLIQRQHNFEGGTLAFWSPIIRRWLAGGKVMALGETQDVTLSTGARGTAMSGTKTLGSKTYQYKLTVVVTEDNVYTFEAWGPADEMARERVGLDKACLTAKIKP